jgi:hypothetical protein
MHDAVRATYSDTVRDLARLPVSLTVTVTVTVPPVTVPCKSDCDNVGLAASNFNETALKTPSRGLRLGVAESRGGGGPARPGARRAPAMTHEASDQAARPGRGGLLLAAVTVGGDGGGGGPLAAALEGAASESAPGPPGPGGRASEWPGK